ncbi:MAG: SpoIIE family protein phosphatase [Bacteroidota bacterium]
MLIVDMWRRISLLGVDDTLNFNMRRKVVLLNSMCALGILVFIALMVINILKKTNPVFYASNLSAQSIFITTLFLNYRKMYQAAAVFCSSVFLVFINLLAVVYGKEAGLEYINVLLCISPFVFFDKKSLIAFFSLLSLAGFFFCKVWYATHPPLAVHNNLAVMYYINMTALFICVFLCIFFFKGEILRYASLVELQRNQLAEKSAELNDSIKYARRIQRTLLRFDEDIQQALPQSFILYLPRDIVSGDFFWFSRHDNRIFGACGDCTGHGVPGAFMCMIGMTLLNEIVNEKRVSRADEVLNLMREGVIRLLKQTGSESDTKDGMDLSFCVFDPENRRLEFSGANQSIYLLRNGQLKEYRGNKQPIGIYGASPAPFTSETISLEKGDLLYFFTDGFADQFGGESFGKAGGKKFKYKRFQDLLRSVRDETMERQKELLKARFEEWKGEMEQTDDILVIGIRVER